MEKLNKRAVGAMKEELACRYLTERGVKILDRNFRCKIGEIDIIGIDQDTYVFFEVKYRRNNLNGMPYEAVNYCKQRKISHVAYFYKTIKKLPNNGSFRFDVISILGDEITWFKNHMSPDNIYQDVKRAIAAIAGKAHRITVVMPFLYESRQHKRYKRESLDAALMLDELVNMGVSNIVTFDAHDPKVENSIPLSGFDNFLPPYQFLRALMNYEKDLIIDKDHLIVISPDEGAVDRAVYFAGVLGVNVGMFYKRRDYSVVVNGKNPIVAHEFLGDNIDGKDVIIIDDMISSGGSMLDTARQLKEMNAKRVFICTTFGLFTEGLDHFDEAYEKCYFDRVITTNLTYHIPALKEKPYYVEANMSKFTASIINFLNHDAAMSSVNTPTDKIKEAIDKYNDRKELNFDD